MEKEYYGAKEIAKITGRCLSSAYELIDYLNNEMIKKYPNVMEIHARIPIWYWNEITKPIEKERRETE